jgi:hypothetical protein
MTLKRETELFVNDQKIDLNEFAHGYVTNIVICAVSMLKGGENVKSLIFKLENRQPKLTINEKVIPLSPFPRDALMGTFTGMASSLKGVSRVDNLRIVIKTTQ